MSAGIISTLLFVIFGSLGQVLRGVDFLLSFFFEVEMWKKTYREGDLPVVFFWIGIAVAAVLGLQWLMKRAERASRDHDSDGN